MFADMIEIMAVFDNRRHHYEQPAYPWSKQLLEERRVMQHWHFDDILQRSEQYIGLMCRVADALHARRFNVVIVSLKENFIAHPLYSYCFSTCFVIGL
jgi:hypothetical protein